jgi:hypothetical protein
MVPWSLGIASIAGGALAAMCPMADRLCRAGPGVWALSSARRDRKRIPARVAAR